MPKINNREVLKRIEREGFIQAGIDKVPDQLGATIAPVLVCNPKPIAVIKGGTCTNATTTTVHTCNSNRKTFITAASLTLIKDATATSTRSRIMVVIDGVSVPLLQIPGITLTAQTEALSITFPTPIEVDKGSVITIVNSANTANVLADGTISYYEVGEE